MFEDLSDDELYQLFALSPKSERIQALIDEHAEGGTYVLRDEAFCEFWYRKIRENNQLSNENINQILKFRDLQSWQGILGDAAKLNVLDEEQCLFLLEEIFPQDWGYKAIQARLLINTIINQSNKGIKCSKDDGSNQSTLRILDKLISLKMTWALLEIVPYLDNEALNILREMMSDKSVLNRANRHFVREKIDKEIKERRKTEKT